MHGLIDFSGARALFVVSGEDAAKFLHGQCTQDIKGLASLGACHAFSLTPKGKIVGDFHALRASADFYLLTDLMQADALEAHFKRYIIMQKVAFRREVGWGAVLFIGEGGENLLKAYLGEQGAALPADKNRAIQHQDALVVRFDRYRELDYELWVPEPRKEAVLARLRQLAARQGISEWTLSDLETHRILQGVPRFGPDYGTDNLPQETGLSECLHFNKGCYTGQEVVARLHFRGHVNKLLAVVEVEAPAMSREEVGRLQILVDDKVIGPMTSFRASEHGWRGLLYVPYKVVEEGRSLLYTAGEPRHHVRVLRKVDIE